MKTVGIVLAGGMSRRFGSPKAFATYKDRMFYEIAVDLLKPLVDQVVIVTNEQLAPLFNEKISQQVNHVVIVLDDEKFAGKGPLAGIYSAIKTIKAERYLLLPCDMPFMEKELLKFLLKKDSKEIDVATFSQGDREHPLVGLYQYSNLDKIAAYLENGGQSVMNYLKTVRVSWIDADQIHPEAERIFRNVNTPESIQKE